MPRPTPPADGPDGAPARPAASPADPASPASGAQATSPSRSAVHVSGSALAIAFATFAIFSAADAIVKWLSADYSVPQITFITTLFACIPIALLMLRGGGIRTLRPRRPGLVALRAILMAVDTALVYFAFSRMPIADTYAIVFAAPLLVAVLSVPLLGERIGWRRSAAITVGFIGVLVVLKPGFAELGLGHVAALASALLFALGLILLRRIGSQESSASLLLSVMLALLALTGPALPFGHRPPALPDLGPMAICGLAIGTAHFTLILAVRRAPAAMVALFQYSQIIWAVAYGLALFGDRPTASIIVGSLIIVGSGLYVLLRESQLARRRRGGTALGSPTPQAPASLADSGPRGAIGESPCRRSSSW